MCLEEVKITMITGSFNKAVILLFKSDPTDIQEKPFIFFSLSSLLMIKIDPQFLYKYFFFIPTICTNFLKLY